MSVSAFKVVIRGLTLVVIVFVGLCWSDLVKYGPWRLLDESGISDSGTISLVGLPGKLRIHLIQMRPRIKSVTGIALSNNKDESVEHVFIFRDDGTGSSLTRSIDAFLDSIVPPSMPKESYREFIGSQSPY